MKISVVILTYNRRDQLRETIRAYINQTYENKEIIVVDNASADGTREMMQSEFPEVSYLWLPYNYNIPALNIGINMAVGDVIWRCDDDSYPESNETFSRVVDIFERFPNIDIIATENIEANAGNAVFEWYHGTVDKSCELADGFRSNIFHGTGAAIRKKVFDSIGGFWEFGFEETDFSTRAVLAGFTIRYFPSIRTLHYSIRRKDSANRWIMSSRQLIRYNWKYFPLPMALRRTTFIFYFQIFLGIIYRQPLSAIIECILAMAAVALSTIRNERSVAPSDRIDDITLGVGAFACHTKFIRQVVRNKIKKWQKK